MYKNTIFIQTANLNDLVLDSMLQSPMLSEQVIKLSLQLSAKKQKQFIACRYLLAKLLSDNFNISSLPNIIIADNSRPQFEDCQLPDFNISHSGDVVGVAICSIGKIGLDIEENRQRKNYLAIAKQFFSTSENNWLHQQADTLAAFWQLWTLRESALKLYAKGVWQMKEITIAMPQQNITAGFANHFYSYYQFFQSIYLSICCSKEIDLIEINK